MNLTIQQIQTQQLSLTPELVLAIKILQCSSTELNELIEDELMSNPLLEVSEKQDADEDADNRFDWTEHAKDRAYDDLASRHNITYSESEDYNYEQFVKAKWSLFDFLHMQLQLVKLEPRIMLIAEYIIDSLDENGFQTESREEISAKLDCSLEDVELAIKTIQSLEPAGIAADNICECLKLQLERKEEYNEIFEQIIFNHLNDLAANRIALIAKAVGLPLDEVIEYCDEIKALDPKPGIRYGQGEENRYIVPDAYLREIDGKFVVVLNERLTPLLNTSTYYERLLSEAQGDKDTIEYLKDKRESALWLIKGIDQRRQTIQKIAEAIVSRQEGFFRQGVSALKPMILLDIAEDVGVHESTVSRAVNGKYIQTPRGLFELKYFFNTGLSSSSGDSISAEAVKKQIQKIIAGEDSKKPYSDEKIKAILLSEYGSNIARRTIAKYRELLGIPGASVRKKY